MRTNFDTHLSPTRLRKVVSRCLSITCVLLRPALMNHYKLTLLGKCCALRIPAAEAAERSSLPICTARHGTTRHGLHGVTLHAVQAGPSAAGAGLSPPATGDSETSRRLDGAATQRPVWTPAGPRPRNRDTDLDYRDRAGGGWPRRNDLLLSNLTHNGQLPLCSD